MDAVKSTATYTRRLTALILFAFTIPAMACQICSPFPEKSAADRLLSAKVAVFARENPDKLFSLRVTEVLKGTPPSKDIDLFVNSGTRRILTNDPQRKLLCVYDPDDKENPWRRIGMTDSEGLYEPLVRKILKLAPEWKEKPESRPAFFGPYLGHENPQLRQLAHLEIARAPYPLIRSLGNTISPKQVRAFLTNFRYLEWHSLYILLLAQSSEKEDHERIRTEASNAAKSGYSSRLSAWTTAWIEIDQEKAIDFYTTHYLSNMQRSPEEVAAVIRAFSVHGTTDDKALRERLIDGYRIVLDQRPVMAPIIAQDLVRWQQWDLVERIIAITGEDYLNLDFAAYLQLRAHRLSTAKPD